jgi:hypothetical protein
LWEKNNLIKERSVPNFWEKKRKENKKTIKSRLIFQKLKEHVIFIKRTGKYSQVSGYGSFILLNIFLEHIVIIPLPFQHFLDQFYFIFLNLSDIRKVRTL